MITTLMLHQHHFYHPGKHYPCSLCSALTLIPHNIASTNNQTTLPRAKVHKTASRHSNFFITVAQHICLQGTVQSLSAGHHNRYLPPVQAELARAKEDAANAKAEAESLRPNFLRRLLSRGASGSSNLGPLEGPVEGPVCEGFGPWPRPELKDMHEQWLAQVIGMLPVLCCVCLSVFPTVSPLLSSPSSCPLSVYVFVCVRVCWREGGCSAGMYVCARTSVGVRTYVCV
jgi:hypothetical protein